MGFVYGIDDTEMRDGNDFAVMEWNVCRMLRGEGYCGPASVGSDFEIMEDGLCRRLRSRSQRDLYCEPWEVLP